MSFMNSVLASVYIGALLLWDSVEVALLYNQVDASEVYTVPGSWRTVLRNMVHPLNDKVNFCFILFIFVPVSKCPVPNAVIPQTQHTIIVSLSFLTLYSISLFVMLATKTQRDMKVAKTTKSYPWRATMEELKEIESWWLDPEWTRENNVISRCPN